MVHCLVRKTAMLAALACSLGSIPSGSVSAHDHSGGNCLNSGCHSSSSGRETVTTPASVSALPGELVSFTINVTNGGSDGIAVLAGKTVSGATTENLTAVAGTANSNNKLNVVPTSSGWTAQPHSATTKTYYTSTASGSSFTSTFSFYVPTGTPADTYQMWMKAGGKSGEQVDQSHVRQRDSAPIRASHLGVVGGRAHRGTCLLAR